MILFGNINKGLAKYRNDTGAILIDVRETDEYAAGHIPEAVNVPLSEIGSIGFPKERTLYLYCLRGARSKKAASILKKMGYRSVHSIGGIGGYKGKTVTAKRDQ